MHVNNFLCKKRKRKSQLPITICLARFRPNDITYWACIQRTKQFTLSGLIVRPANRNRAFRYKLKAQREHNTTQGPI